MQTTDTQVGGGEPTGDGSISYFRCAYCGASERSTEIEYSALGFPRCPVCQTRHGP